jgi:NAD(P)-dependent dehydrogenase (short-subunit alcohol dehydrogenase family)
MATASTMTGKICLVTGGTAGIGFVAARELARRGAKVTIVGRDTARGAAAVQSIRAAVGSDEVDFISVDLAEQAQLRAFAASFAEQNPRLDVLVDNAGGLFGRRQTTTDGIERTFALNHLGYFATTLLLLPLLKAAAPARVVLVASEAHRGARIDFDDLQGEHRYSRWQAYRQSKLANLLFTYELARRLGAQGVTANALHPGFVATEIGTRHRFVPGIFWRIGTLAAISPEQGAQTIVHLACAQEVTDVTGGYFIDSRPVRSSPASQDRKTGDRLWDISLNLTGLPDI